MIIAIDFDGVIALYDGYRGKGIFGDVIPGAKEGLEKLKKSGHKIMIYTSRSEVDDVEKFLKENEIPYDYINQSPLNKERGLNPAKQQADVYLDDRAIYFDGHWTYGLIDTINNFLPWWKRIKPWWRMEDQ